MSTEFLRTDDEVADRTVAVLTVRRWMQSEVKRREHWSRDAERFQRPRQNTAARQPITERSGPSIASQTPILPLLPPAGGTLSFPTVFAVQRISSIRYTVSQPFD